jgi:HK97 family phage portal protein
MLERIKRWFRPQATGPDSKLSFDQLSQWLTTGFTSTGVPLNERSASAVSAVYACVGLIGGAISSLPLHVYRDDDSGRQRMPKDALWYLLNEQWAPRWGAATAWQYVAWSRLLYGDGFVRIVRTGRLSPDIRALEPLHPSHVIPIPFSGDGSPLTQLAYQVTDPLTGKVDVVLQDDMLHFPMPWFDPVVGRSLSPIRHALRNAAGIALAADEYSATFFKNGARPDFAITTEAKLTQPQIDSFRQMWEERYSGASNSHKPAVLQNMDVKQLSMSAEETQLISTRQFQIEDVARIFRVPPHMIGHTDKTTSWGSGVEEMGIGFVMYTLQPHLTAIEQEINRKFFLRGAKFSEFNAEGLLRGDSKARSDFYRGALGGSAGPGWMTRNEVRRLENMPPIDGGDQLTDWKPNVQKDPAATV